MNDEAIQKIISYANEYLFEPRSNWSKQAIIAYIIQKEVKENVAND